MNALLIGINYTGTVNQLQGCIFDVIEMKSLIIDAYRFNPNTIVVLRDDDPANRPTKARILQELRRLVANSDPSSNTFLHYSGHGTQITDTGHDEVDQLDECIVPCDYATAGFITDDEINAIFKPLKGAGLAIFDCCRSGTIMDLSCSGISTVPGFYCFSGCTDSQDVQEGTTSTQGSNTGLPQGAMTMAFISTIRTLQYYPPIPVLLSSLRDYLHVSGYTQTPQLTSNVSVTQITPFPFQAPVAQLQSQSQLVLSLQSQIPVLEAQIAVLQQQVVGMTILEASSNLLSVVQNQNQILQNKNQALQKQVETLPSLRQQAALVPQLQRQVSLIPGLQNQIAVLMYQQVLVQQLQRELAAARR